MFNIRLLILDSFLKQYNKAALINGSDNDKTLFIAAFLEDLYLLTFFEKKQEDNSNIKWVNFEKNILKEFEPIVQTEMIG